MSSWVGRVVASCARHPFIVLLLSLALTAVALVYSAGHFAMTTDTAQLISTKDKWRQHELAYERAFPSLQWLTIVVIDGATPELAEHAASHLSAALAQKPALFHGVRRPDGGPFFDRNGLLFLPLPEVQVATEGLLRSQFMLASLAADPSLRGVLATLSRALQGVQHGQAKLADFQPLMAALADTFEKAAAGQPAWFSWQDVMGDPSNGTSGSKRQTRRILIVQPVLDYSALQPGQAASDAIRTTARSLGLDPAHGVTIRLTGPAPLSDEEFASLAEDSHLVAAAMVIALLGILWWAVRSGRVVAAMLLATFMGLLMTTGLGLLVTGRLNLISVAFIPLFVGLGIDFSIQFSVRFLAERHFQPGDREALAAAGRGVGLPLALAAAAIGAGFFAFLPTDYVGVAELGLIAGLGMVIAFALTVTLLPALLALLRPAPGALEEVGFTGLAPVEAYLRRNRRAVLAVSLVVALVSAAALPLVRFDFNPLHLKSAKVESMATLADLRADPDWTPDTINVLAPSLAAAEPVERRLAALPEVSRTVTLRSFVPEGQPEKLALIRATAQRLGPALDVPAAPSRPNEGPSDEGVRHALVATASALRQAATDGGPASQAALRLADALDRLQQATPDVRAAADRAIVLPLRVMLERVRASLQAGPVTIDSLPADLVSDWIGKDGGARIQLFPRPELQTDDGLWRFARAVQAVAPDATGVPISIHAAGDTVVVSFLQAGAWSFVAITAILAVALRRVRDVVLTMLPVVLSGLLTFATSAVLDLPLNFANIIALPLLFGVGVAFNIYFVMAWRAGETAPLQSSLMRAVVFSALTTATAFGALWLSSHPGTASMGRLLMISLAWELLVTLLFRPALLALPPANREAGR